ncbi:unnamed protein product [Rotaria sp. Silwood2]|nr:unnamed protein product [Rotaria sp. Silwood2]
MQQTGHAKKSCRAAYDRCRRCGENRINGDHLQCKITCHHCGGDHQANDYKCPIILKFRRELIAQLRNNPNKLPRHIQMFNPLDCRIQRDEKILSNENTNNNEKSNLPFIYSNSLRE